MQDYKLFIP